MSRFAVLGLFHHQTRCSVSDGLSKKGVVSLAAMIVAAVTLLIPSNSAPVGVPASCTPPTHPLLAVHFSPNGGATGAIVEALQRARGHVLVAAYTFTSAQIAKAIVEAHRRGLVVEVILDRKEAGKMYSSADFLARMGIPTYIDGAHPSAHNKVIVIDSQVVITGSFNFTVAAERQNAENLLVIRDEGLAAQYADNWRLHAAHAVRYAGR